MPEPPPRRPASEMVWCGARKGRAVRMPVPFGKTPATLWTCVVSIASSKVSGGRMPANRLASIVLPDPGGPIISAIGTEERGLGWQDATQLQPASGDYYFIEQQL